MRMIVRVRTPLADTRHSQFAVAAGLSSRASTLFMAALFSAALFSLPPARAQYVQQGPKLIGSGFVGTPQQGFSVALTDNGNTASGGFGNVPTTFSVAVTGDFDGNGTSDLLWRDTSGNTSIWFLNGLQVTSSVNLGNVPTSWSVQSTNAD
jgi:hypothetical protein